MCGSEPCHNCRILREVIADLKAQPCTCERADAIKSLVSISRIVEKVSTERDAALATIGRVRALCDSNIDVATRDGYLLVATIRAALEPTPKGTK